MDDGRYTEELMEQDYQKYCDERKAYEKIVEDIEPEHEDELIIERIDMEKFYTFLPLDPRADKDRVRQSWYGRVLKVSDVPGDFPVREFKKERMRQKIGKIINYNPDSAYSLNIRGFYGIWVLSIDNVMNTLHGVDIFKLQKDMLQSRIGMFWKP